VTVGRRVVVVGASLGAVSFIEALRKRGGDHSIVLVGQEPHLPYDRPPLSKQFLLDQSAAPPLLKPAEWYEQNEVDLALGQEVTDLQTQPLSVTLAGGERIGADEIVIATGCRARELPIADQVSGLHYLRTLDDAARLRALFNTTGRLVVLGAGFIGLEAGAAAAQRGWDVVVLEREPSPLVRVVGAELGRLCLDGYLREGVDVRCDCSVTGLLGESAVRGVTLGAGDDLEADAVLAGIGAVPNTEWLEGSGVAVDNGVLCDRAGRTSVPGVWAVGDVARWPNAVTGRRDRVEQWQAARDHGAIVAGNMVSHAEEATWKAPPYFWSDLFDAKVQFVGHCDPGASVRIFRRDGKAVAVFGRERLEGVLTVSAPRALALGRRHLMSGATYGEASEWAENALAA
jgi:3-phenylpropionate/trans-cinnamate dioxygenase ferredoxin reductase subunit